jgi:putative transcriptional regulator
MLKFLTRNFNFPQKYVMDKLNELKLLGQRIRELRIEKRLSQAKLGLKIYKDQQSIHKVEAGQFNPTYIYLLEICEGLEISIEELFRK